MPKIEHLIVLMLENRSFDHMLGYLKSDTYQIEGLAGTEMNRDDRGEPVRVSSDARYGGDFDPDPGHDFSDVVLQLYGTSTPAPGQEPDMSGFVKSYARMCSGDSTSSHRIMKCFHPSRLPVLATLAQEFAVCDHWFSSVPGPTIPNRLFAHCGTSNGRLDLSPEFFKGFTSVYEVLDKADVGATLYSPGWTIAATFPYLLKYQEQFFGTLDQFFQDCDENELPPYCFLEPRYGSGIVNDVFLPQNDQHPDSDVFEGEKLTRRVYEAIRGNKSVWESSILVVTYDEHGGLFDHVAPGPADSPDDKTSDNPNFDFKRLGVRVPAVVVSPYIKAKTIDHTQYDITSLIATALDMFGVPREKMPAAPGSTKPNARVLKAKNFKDGCLNLDQPRQDKVAFPPMGGGSTQTTPSALNDLHIEHLRQAGYLDSQLAPRLQIRSDAARIAADNTPYPYIRGAFPNDSDADEYLNSVFAALRASVSGGR